ncbi:MAG: hypothetical protein ACRDQE_06955 [Gaiellales bacterium]
MYRLKAAPVAAAVAVIAAGCGGTATSGSGSASTDPTHSTTTTTAESGSTGSSTDDGAGTLSSVSSTRQMRAYFRHVDRVRQQLVVTRRSTRALNAAIKARDGTAAGAAARSAAAGVQKALVIAKRIKPDEPLRTINSELLANLRLGVVYLTRMANDLDSENPARIHRWRTTVVPTIRRSERWYAEWAAGSAALARSLGVRPPRWLHTMDRWN